MKVLGISSQRPDKIRLPIHVLGKDGDFIDLSVYRSKYKKVKELCRLLPKKINILSPDAILVNGGGIIANIAQIYGEITNIPTIGRFGGDIFENPFDENALPSTSRRLLKYWEQKSVSAFDGIFVVSKELKSIFSNYTTLPDDLIKILYVPINVENYSNCNTTCHREQFVITTVANLNRYRKFQGIINIIDSLAPLISEEDFIYEIAGGGGYEQDLRQYVNESNINSDNIRILGYVDNIKKVYSKSNIFIYISYIDGYPNVILEAMASGLPIITNRRHGMIEQVSHLKSGILLDSNPSKTSLINWTHRLYKNPRLRESLGNYAKKETMKRNNPAKICEMMIRGLEHMGVKYDR